MRISEVIWLNDVIDKIEAKHHVTQTEVEKVLYSKPTVKKMRKGYFRGEHVYRALGKTETGGRYLTIFFIHKGIDKVLILSARDMDKKERKIHAKK